MNSYTILNVKTDKKLKADAKKVSEELGVPLSTIVNAFLKQFVRDKEVTLSLHQHSPSPYLVRLIDAAREEFEAGKSIGPMNAEQLIKHLKAL